MKKIARYILGFIFSLLFRFVVYVRNKAYDLGLFKTRHFPEVCIISVGNLSTGGTGKTPFCEYLLTGLCERGIATAYLSRGYGRNTKGFIKVSPDALSNEVGDEALQVAQKFPTISVAVCESRIEGVERLLRENPAIQVIILDDAFQHRAIGRNIDVVLTDAESLPWKDAFLPAGSLREGPSSLKRADFVVVRNVERDRDKLSIEKRVRKHKLLYSKTTPLLFKPFFPEKYPEISLHDARTRSAIVFAGIGEPEQFFNLAKNAGINLMQKYAFGDHRPYNSAKLKPLLRRFRSLSKQPYFLTPPFLLTTEKDYSRIRGAAWFDEECGELPFYYITISVEIADGEARLWKSIDEKIAKIQR